MPVCEGFLVSFFIFTFLLHLAHSTRTFTDPGWAESVKITLLPFPGNDVRVMVVAEMMVQQDESCTNSCEILTPVRERVLK